MQCQKNKMTFITLNGLTSRVFNNSKSSLYRIIQDVFIECCNQPNKAFYILWLKDFPQTNPLNFTRFIRFSSKPATGNLTNYLDNQFFCKVSHSDSDYYALSWAGTQIPAWNTYVPYLCHLPST